jgi:hypothetical protein
VQMPGFLGRLADVLARHLLSWLHRRVEPGSREWLDALTAESECADDGWQRLRWALGGVSLVWTINQRRQKNEPTRGTMRALIVPGPRVRHVRGDPRRTDRPTREPTLGQGHHRSTLTVERPL